MTLPSRAVSSWFGNRKNDIVSLEQWRNAPLTYTPDQETNGEWNVDRYEVILGVDRSGELFQRAGLLTLRNRFYPKQVMATTSDYEIENRPVRKGDRVLQRIHILQPWGRSLFDVLTVNEITEVIDEPRHKGFTYTTTTVHSEIGEWSPSVVWRENGEVALIIEVVSRNRPGASRFAQRLTRWLQLRAHRLSIENFRAILMGARPSTATSSEFVPAALLPVGMIALAVSLFLLAVRAFYRRRQ